MHFPSDDEDEDWVPDEVCTICIYLTYSITRSDDFLGNLPEMYTSKFDVLLLDNAESIFRSFGILAVFDVSDAKSRDGHLKPVHQKDVR